MRKIGLFTGSLLLFLWVSMSSVVAAGLTLTKSGIVTDKDHLFTSSQIQSLDQKLASMHRYNFYVLTVPSLYGESISALSNHVFNQWNMGGNDVLLVIAPNQREGYIDVQSNSPLDTIVKHRFSGSTTAAKYRNLIQQTFIPDARQGNFTGAVLAVANKMENLTPLSTIIELIFGIILLLALIVSTLLVFVFATRTKNQIQKRIGDLKVRLHDLYERIASVNETLAFVLATTSGKTKEKYEVLQSNLDKSNTLLVESGGKLLDLHVKLFKGKLLSPLINSTEEQMNQVSNLLNQHESTLKSIKKTQEDLKKETQKFQEGMETFHRDYAQLQAPFSNLQKEMDALNAQVKQIQEANGTDPVQALGSVQNARKALDTLVSKIHALQTHLGKWQTLKNELGQVEQLANQLEHDENFVFSSSNAPLALVKTLQNSASTLTKWLEQEDANSFISSMDNFEQQLSHTQEKLKHWVSLFTNNQNQLNQIRDKRHSFESATMQSILRDLDAIQTTYHKTHWSPLNHLFEKMKNDLTTVDDFLEKSEAQIAKRDQVSAESTLGNASILLNEIFTEQEKLIHAKKTLDSRYQQASSNFNQQQERVQQIKQKVSNSSISIRSLTNQYNQVEDALQRTPYNLDSIEEQSQHLEREIKNAQNQIENWKREQRQAKERLQQLHRSYQQRQGNYHSSWSNPHTRIYDGYYSQAQDYFDAGDFLQAAATMELAEATLDSMDSDYDDWRRNSFDNNFGIDNNNFWDNNNDNNSWDNSSNDSGGGDSWNDDNSGGGFDW